MQRKYSSCPVTRKKGFSSWDACLGFGTLHDQDDVNACMMARRRKKLSPLVVVVSVPCLHSTKIHTVLSRCWDSLWRLD